MSKELLKSIHDQLIENMPEGANHDQCPLCADTESTCDHTAKEGEMSTVTTYTQEDFDTAVAAAIAAAVAPLEQQIAELKLSATQETSAKEKADLEAQLAELQLAHDKLTLDLSEAVAKYDTYVAELEQMTIAAAEEEAKKAKKADRVAKMKMYAFTDEYIEAQADRWAAMTDEAFEAHVSDLESSGAKKAATDEADKKEDETLPPQTAMTASAGKPAKNADMSAVRDVLSMKFRGIDPSTV